MITINTVVSIIAVVWRCTLRYYMGRRYFSVIEGVGGGVKATGKIVKF